MVRREASEIKSRCSDQPKLGAILRPGTLSFKDGQFSCEIPDSKV